MEADFRVDSIFVDEELGEMFAKCYDNVYGEEFEKFLGSPNTEEGRQNALTILEDGTYTMTDELRNEFISTFGLDDFGQETIEVEEEEDFYDDSEDDVVESFSIREALNKIDLYNDNKYDLLNLYESCTLNENEKRELGKLLYDQADSSVIYDTLNKKYISEHYDDCPELYDELFGKLEDMDIIINKTLNLSEDELDGEFVDETLDTLEDIVDEAKDIVDDIKEHKDLDEDLDKETLKSKLEKATREFVTNTLGYDNDFVDDYIFVEVKEDKFSDGSEAIKCEIRTELDYEECVDLSTHLNPILFAEDKYAYFDMEDPHTLSAYIRTDFSDDVVDEETVNEYADLIKDVSSMEELRKLYKDIRDLFEDRWTSATFAKVHDLVMDKADEINKNEYTNESLLQDLQKDHKAVKDTYGQEVYDALDTYVENGNDLGDVLYKESEWNKFVDWAKKEKGIEVKSNVNESKSINEDFGDITALADDCGKNTFKVSTKDIRFTFENEDDKTKFVNELLSNNIPHNELTFGVVSINKSDVLDESKSIKEDYEADTMTFAQWFDENEQQDDEKYYPFDNYVKTFENAEVLRNATARDILNNAHIFYDVYPVDSIDRETAFNFASEVLGLDYDVFYDAWLSGSPVPGTNLDESTSIKDEVIHEDTTDRPVEFKAGYHEWNVLLNGEIIYSFGDFGETLEGCTDKDTLGYEVEDYIQVMLDELNESGKNIQLTNGEFDALKNQMVAKLGHHYLDLDESKSIKESDEETPYTKEEVERDLKSITHNFTDKEGELKCGFEEEKNFGVEILKQHYKVVEASGDDRRDGTWYHISFANPLEDKSIDEGYELLSGNKVEVYSDYDIAKKRAEELGLKEAEYGDIYRSNYSYCFWNETGDSNDEEQVIAYYTFEGGKPRPLTEDEREEVISRYEIGSFDNV